MRCPCCQVALPPAGRFRLNCGAALPDTSQTPTTAPIASPPKTIKPELSRWDGIAMTEMAPENSTGNSFQAVPFLAVSDMRGSLRFCGDGLGFVVARQWIDEGAIRWCRLERGGAALMLQDFRRVGGKPWSPPGPLGLGVSILFICDDAVAIWREATRNGLLASRPFVGNGMWVTSLQDPDGYRIEFESVTEAAQETVFFDGAAAVRGGGSCRSLSCSPRTRPFRCSGSRPATISARC